jgi:hypothetical protein
LTGGRKDDFVLIAEMQIIADQKAEVSNEQDNFGKKAKYQFVFPFCKPVKLKLVRFAIIVSLRYAMPVTNVSWEANDKMAGEILLILLLFNGHDKIGWLTVLSGCVHMFAAAI